MAMWWWDNDDLVLRHLQREPSVKTLRSPLSAEFWRHCVSCVTSERRNENISLPRVGIEPTTSRFTVTFSTFAPRPTYMYLRSKLF